MSLRRSVSEDSYCRERSRTAPLRESPIMDEFFFLRTLQDIRAVIENVENGCGKLVIVIGSGFCGLAVADRILRKHDSCKVLVLERGPFFLPEHYENSTLSVPKDFEDLPEDHPWSVSSRMKLNTTGTVRNLHGIVPYFGGKSTLWSAWCPTPSPEELHQWPAQTKCNLIEYIPEARNLLRVKDVASVDGEHDRKTLKVLNKKRPVFRYLQKTIDKLAKSARGKNGIYKVDAAEFATSTRSENGIDFQKFSVPEILLDLKQEYNERLFVSTNCTVKEIIHNSGRPTELVTSMGTFPVTGFPLIMSMGTLPSTTLVRNSFPLLPGIGERLSAHFISSIVARVSRTDYQQSHHFLERESGAFYVAGIANNSYRQQYHIQMKVFSDKGPQDKTPPEFRRKECLKNCQDHIVFSCAVVGELDVDNDHNWFRKNPEDGHLLTNSTIQALENDKDRATWDTMDEATFEFLEDCLSPKGKTRVEYYHPSSTTHKWSQDRPTPDERRSPNLVHELSTMHLGDSDTDPVDLSYRLRGTENVYITGGSLWPRAGSWNPTLSEVALTQHLADILIDKMK